jgi:hypothetical protein
MSGIWSILEGLRSKLALSGYANTAKLKQNALLCPEGLLLKSIKIAQLLRITSGDNHEHKL